MKNIQKLRAKVRADDCSWQFHVLARKLDIHLKTEHRFHPTRRWRFDYAFVPFKVAVEINGGVWIQGRHNRGKGYLGDMEKLNAAQTLGWVVLQFPPDNIDFRQIEKTITDRQTMQFPR